MAVKSQTLNRPERDLALRTREGDAVAEPEEAVDELAQLTARLDEARRLTPQGPELHCADCFRRGRDAAIRVIEGKPRS